MRIIGLDIGDRTIGVAVCDPTGLIAQGVDTIRRTKKEDDMEAVAKYCSQFEAETIVAGLPKNMNGTLGPQSEKVLEFVEELKKIISIKIVMWDERLTTVAANRAMLEADLSRQKRKKIVDKVAATYILQGYLDSLKRNY